MKRIFYAILLGFISLQVSAQNYTYIPISGGTVYPYTSIDFPFTEPPVQTTLISAPTNDQFSSWYTLPFNFTFYGKTVTGFKVSNNGFITFNQSTTNTNVNDSLSNSDAPSNSIFAFWTALDVRSTDTMSINGYDYVFPSSVSTWTTGQPGNRVCYIYWSMVSNQKVYSTSGNAMNFAIRLFETGGFDLVYSEEMGNIGSMSATIGCKSWDGVHYTMVTPSPYISYPGSSSSPVNNYAITSDIIYRFAEPAEPTVNFAIDNYYIPDEMESGGTNPITLYVEDRGSNIDSALNYVINISVNGGAPIIDATPLAITPNQVTVVTLEGNSSTSHFNGDLLNYTNNIKIWISCPYAHSKTNDTLIGGFTFVPANLNSYEVHPMVEEFTGAWCGYCPDGMQGIDDLLADPTSWDAIVVSIHNDQGYQINDSMSIPDGYTISNNLESGFPSASVSRERFNYTNGTSALSMGFPLPAAGTTVGASLIQLYDNIKYQSDGVTPQLSPAQVNVEQSYDSTTRLLTVTLHPKFSDSVMRYKLFYNVYLEESGVKGSPGQYLETSTSYDQGYDQHIYSEYQIQQSIFYDYPGAFSIGTGVWAMPNFTHNHVLRAALEGVEGYAPTATDLPTSYSFGTDYPVTFTYPIPKNWNDKHINIIGFVNYFDLNSYNSEVILAANQLPMTATQNGQTTMSGIKQPEQSAIMFDNIFPNPSNGNFTADIAFAHPTSASCELTDITGKTIMAQPSQAFGAGIQSLNFNLTSLTPGIYFLTIKSDVGSSTQKIMISR